MSHAARQLTVGLIGAGTMGGIHLSAWRALGAKVAVYSADGRARALTAGAGHSEQQAQGEQQARGEQQAPEVVDTLDELLDRCAVVDICTPTFTHKDLILAAAEATRHIICEKPLARTLDEAEQAAQAAARAGVMLLPAHVVRFFPEYEVMASAVRDGMIGEPAVLRFTRAGRYPSWAPWFADEKLSGGILLDQMIHDFDFARYIAGDVTTVHAQVRGATEVVAATAILTHASRAITHVHGEWGLPQTPFRTTFRIAGAGGVLQHDSGQTRSFRVTQRTQRTQRMQHTQRALRTQGGVPDTESPYRAELQEFARAITDGVQPRVSAGDGVEAVRIATAAIESAATGRAVEIAGAGQ